MAQTLGKTVGELLGESPQLSYREYQSWIAFLEIELGNPSKQDAYMMQIAHEARYAFRTKRPAFNTKDYTLQFGESKKAKVDIQQATTLSKNRWVGMVAAGPTGQHLSIKRRIRRKDGTIEELD